MSEENNGRFVGTKHDIVPLGKIRKVENRLTEQQKRDNEENAKTLREAFSDEGED